MYMWSCERSQWGDGSTHLYALPANLPLFKLAAHGCAVSLFLTDS
jgi:hypothetical protein